MDRLKRKPFAAQAEVVQAITALLLDRNEQAGIINAEMGTGKTMMAIAVAAVMHAAAIAGPWSSLRRTWSTSGAARF